jgi:hypothetical protein
MNCSRSTSNESEAPRLGVGALSSSSRVGRGRVRDAGGVKHVRVGTAGLNRVEGEADWSTAELIAERSPRSSVASTRRKPVQASSKAGRPHIPAGGYYEWVTRRRGDSWPERHTSQRRTPRHRLKFSNTPRRATGATKPHWPDHTDSDPGIPIARRGAGRARYRVQEC